MGYTLPDGTLPYPPPKPPLVITPQSPVTMSLPAKTRRRATGNFSRCFICTVGNYRNGKDRNVNIIALKEIFLASNDAQIGSTVLRTNHSIAVQIERKESVFFYVWTKGEEIDNSVTIENIDNGNKLIVFSSTEIMV